MHTHTHSLVVPPPSEIRGYRSAGAGKIMDMIRGRYVVFPLPPSKTNPEA